MLAKKLRGVMKFGSSSGVTPPTLVSEYATAFNTNTTPKTAMNAVSISSGDVLVCLACTESHDTSIAFTENGTAALTTLQSDTATNYTPVIARGYVASTGESITITVTGAGTVTYFGGNVLRFSGSAGIGASAKAQGSTGSPSVSITTTVANSAIVAICGDWNATTGTQTWSNSPTTASKKTGYVGDNAHYGCSVVYYNDVGAVGAKTISMTAPSGQKWNIIAVEVKGQ